MFKNYNTHSKEVKKMLYPTFPADMSELDHDFNGLPKPNTFRLHIFRLLVCTELLLNEIKQINHYISSPCAF